MANMTNHCVFRAFIRRYWGAFHSCFAIVGSDRKGVEIDITFRRDSRAILSPFGMGILDIAVGKYVYDAAAAHNDLIAIDDFFYERKRW